MHKIGSYKIGKFTSISENSPRDLTKPEFIKLQTQHNNAAAWCSHSIRKATNPKATHQYKYSHHAFVSTKEKASQIVLQSSCTSPETLSVGTTFHEDLHLPHLTINN